MTQTAEQEQTTIGFPRRFSAQRWSNAESAIQRAVDIVEEMGADVRLTDAVVLLGAARERVADFVDGVEGHRTIAQQLPVEGTPDGQ